MFIYLNKKGQSTLEYSIVIAVIIAALIAMQTYIKRGVSGGMKDAADDLGKQFSYQNSSMSNFTNTSASSTENIVGGAQPTTTTVTSQTQTRNDSIDVQPAADEWWP